ncbi:MAG: Asp-tRNA(Asn)/Glu-tRNA(Gln) amidotransferase subunit GatA [Elusimicrobiota bacterium]
MELHKLSAIELSKKIVTREISAVKTVEYFLDRITLLEPEISAFNFVFKDAAIEKAKEIDGKISNGQPCGPLCGVPVAIKDNINIKGAPTTCSSKILKDYISPYDAAVISRLRDSDAVFIGKTNMDEFAMGSSTENSAFKITKNPCGKEYIPGGSSGGSAAVVASGMCLLSIGSDTGGSIRQPASFCGVVGLKPTYGRVSRYGLVAFASSLDQIGPFAANVRDCAELLRIISGYDFRDSTSIDSALPGDISSRIERDIKGIKVGLPKEYFIQGIDPEITQSINKSVDILKGMGADIIEISLPHTGYALSVYYIIAPSEASANLARYDGVKYGFRADISADTLSVMEAGGEPSGELLSIYKKTRGEGFGPEVKRRIMLGTYALSSGYYEAYYGKAQKVRTLIKNDFDEAFKKVDVILTPTTPTTAFKIGEKVQDPLQMYLSDIFTIPCNLAGLPGISVPCGWTKGGLPVGMQILGRPLDEETVLRVAYNFEKNSPALRPALRGNAV